MTSFISFDVGFSAVLGEVQCCLWVLFRNAVFFAPAPIAAAPLHPSTSALCPAGYQMYHQQGSTALDQRAFRDALGAFPTGVTVITTHSSDGPLGMTANSFASLSMEPPLVLWSPANASRRAAAFVGADLFNIHILEIGQHALADAFAQSGRAPFETAGWTSGPSGPEFADVAALLRCRRYAVYPGGDHSLIIGEVISFEHSCEHVPLVFHRGQYPSLR